MLIKKSWAVFVPVTVLCIALKAMQLSLSKGGAFYIFNEKNIPVFILILFAVLFLSTLLLNVLDKKTPPEYSTGRNLPAGISAMLLALVLAADGAFRFTNAFNVKIAFSELILAISSILAGVVFVAIGLGNVTGTNKSRGISVLVLAPTAWSCVKLVSTFMAYTKVSVASTDMHDLVFIIFATLFLFNHALIFTWVLGKNPVKSCYLYGLTAIAICFTYVTQAVFEVQKSGSFKISQNYDSIEFLLLSVFMLSFLVELSRNTVQSRISEYENDDDDGSFSDDKYDDFIRNYPKEKSKEKASLAFLDSVEERQAEPEYAESDLENYEHEEPLNTSDRTEPATDTGNENSTDSSISADSLLKKIDELLE